MNNFIIERNLIKPVQNILNLFNNHEIRDCDIKWLDNNLAKFTDIACKTLHMDVMMPMNEGFTVINEYVKKWYVEKFTILLNYFTSYIN